MWPKSYRDYPPDKPLIKHKVLTGKGIVGCEMHEINGWGETWHVSQRKPTKRGTIRGLLEAFFRKFRFKSGES